MSRHLQFRVQGFGFDPIYIEMKWCGRLLASFAMCVLMHAAAHGAESRPAWQAEWERTVKAAEAEGQLTV